MTPQLIQKNLSYVEQYLQPLEDYLIDDNINEIVINPDGAIFVEVSGAVSMQRIDVSLSELAIKRLGAQLAGETNNTLGTTRPIVSGRAMVWGRPMRVQIVVDPAIENGVSLSIRKFLSHTLECSDLKFVYGTQVDVEQQRQERHAKIKEMAAAGNLQEVFRRAVDERFNILVAGGTSSGKTTVARALLNMCDKDERIITIEDAQELNPSHTNKVALIADRRVNSERSPAKLLESCLRMRPDRIIVGEIRGAEAYDFLEAINTGHPGAITTIHADSPSLAFDRLALMVMRTGIQMTHSDIISYAKRTIDMVVQVGRRGGQRGILEVYLPSMNEH